MPASTMRSSRARTVRRRAAALVLAAAATGASLAGCASEPTDPAELREQRVQARIEDSFSRSQADCIMQVLDAPTIKALDRSTKLPADSEAMRIYSNAVVACAGAG